MKKPLSGIMVILLLTSMLALALSIQPVGATVTIYIRADGSIDPPTANITSFDDVTYTFTDNNYGEIVVERDDVILDGAGYTLQGSSDWSKGVDLTGRTNVTIENIEITSFYYGIYLSSSSNSVYGNTITNNNVGIELTSSSGNIVSENNITANNIIGVQLRYSSNNNTVSGNNFVDDGLVIYDSFGNVVVDNLVNGKPLVYLEGVSDVVVVEDAGQVILVNCNLIHVENLTISNTDYGVQLWNTHNTTITRNTMMNNRYGFDLSVSSNNTVSGNNITANNYYGVYLRHSSDNTVSGNNIGNNRYGVHISDSINNTVSGNNIGNNRYGILLSGSSNSVSGNNITNNGITRQGCGILLSGSSNSVSGNNITNNYNGINLHISSNNSVSGNNITANTNYGINSYDSFNNKVFHNNFINNTNQLYSINSVNVWDNGYPSGGNAWSDYKSLDLFSGPFQNETGSDEIGDTPYVIDDNNQDNYPLIKPHLWSSHDIGIMSVTVSKMVVGQGYDAYINVTVGNYGRNTEHSNATADANATIMGAFENITISSRSSATLTIEWNTTNWAKGNYHINLHITPVPGETDLSDNDFMDGWILVTIPGDVDGDRDVDIFDIVVMAGVYGSERGDPEYVPNCDINGNGDIDIFDIVIAAGNYGESW